MHYSRIHDLRALLLKIVLGSMCVGVSVWFIGLERPCPNLDSLAIDPAAMRKEEERFYHFGV